VRFSDPFDSRRNLWIIGFAFVVSALALPEVLPTFWIGIVTEMFIFGLFALSFNLMYGYTGMLSFGHAAFYGIGAYGVAFVLAGKIPFVPAVEGLLPAIVLSVLIVTVVGAFAGVICVVRRGIYFAMLTLAVNMLFFTIAREQDWLTGGREGIFVGNPSVDLIIFSFSANETALYYYFVFTVVAGAAVLMLRVVNSPYGELLKSIRENDQRTEFIGISVRRYTWSSFVLSTAFAGLAGALFSIRMFLVNPSIMHWSVSAEPVFATLIGGPTTFFGPMFGAFVMTLLEEQLTGFTVFWQFWLGVLLIPIVLYFPKGILGNALDYIKKQGS
jgi:branched-chain amino acid transport system permease protein